MKMKLIVSMMLLALVCGCSERARQKNLFTGGDPALATQKSVDELKTLINERFDKLEKQQSSNAAGQIGGFLYGFIQHWITASDDYSAFHNKRTDLDRKESIKMSGYQLGVLGKICEFPTDPKPLLQTLDFTTLLAKRSVEYERITNANI